VPTHEAGKTEKSGENGLERDSPKEGRRDLVTATLAANVMTILMLYAAIGA
jgi:hypothetical protein